MRIIPLVNSWNLLTQGSDGGDAREWLRSAPAANITSVNFREPAIGNGVFVIEAGTNDDLDFNEGGGELTATLTAGSYYNGMALAQEVETQLEATGAHSYTVLWEQDGTNRYRFTIADGTGTVALPVASGTNTATSCMFTLGFGDYDRAAGASHVGDLGMIHDPVYGARVRRTSVDGIARCAVLVGPLGGFSVRGRATFAGASPARYDLGDYDDDFMVTFFDAVDNASVGFELLCPHGPDTQLVGAGFAYVGDYYSPSRYWQVDTFDLSPLESSTVHRTKSGRAYIGAEYAQRYSLKVGWSGEPGYDPDDLPQLRSLLTDLGIGDPLVVALDPDNEPRRESYLCRLVSMPQLTKIYGEGAPGRWGLELDLETVSVR